MNTFIKRGDNPRSVWWRRPEIILPVFISIISVPWWPSWYSRFLPTNIEQNQNEASIIDPKLLDRSVFEIVVKSEFKESRLKTEERWKDYGGFKTKEEYATIINFGDAGSERIWVEFKSIDQYNGRTAYITCIFDDEWRQRIKLRGENDGEATTTLFSGTIRGDLTNEGIPIIDNCILK